MVKPKQAKGMAHIRNLKREAKLMWRECGRREYMWIDCVNAAMLQHRLELIKDVKQDLNNEPTGNPS